VRGGDQKHHPAVAWVPHPIQNRTAAELEAIADGVLDEMLALIRN
jgi:hypothetical protein